MSVLFGCIFSCCFCCFTPFFVCFHLGFCLFGVRKCCSGHGRFILAPCGLPTYSLHPLRVELFTHDGCCHVQGVCLLSFARCGSGLLHVVSALLVSFLSLWYCFALPCSLYTPSLSIPWLYWCIYIHVYTRRKQHKFVSLGLGC